jgi:hypothetical protein
MGTWNFREFIRFFQKGWNPFKIHGRFKLDWVPNIYIMRYSGNLKFSQWTKLFIMFKSSTLQSFNIFGPWEGREFELHSLEVIWINGKRFGTMNWARQVLQSRPTQTDSIRRSFGQSVSRDRTTVEWSFLPNRPVPPAPPGCKDRWIKRG